MDFDVHTTLNDRAMPSADAARWLGVSPLVLGVWRQRGIGPPYSKISRFLILYRLSDLLAFLEAHRTVPPRLTPRPFPGRLPKGHPQAKTKVRR